ncbi:MAG TPA: HRDC domain-containing protein [Acidimicrobiales bacterium]|jgi:ribonuclease D|nr:HRDC domain-containing protein [Acidimicrobiales bacterium]
MASDFQFINTASGFTDVIAALGGVEAYALDTEFHRERTYYPRLALLQIAWPDGLVLVDPLAVDVAPLAKIFRTDAIAVLHAADQDLEVLLQGCGEVPAVMFDTQVAAGFLGYSSPSLVNLTEAILGIRLHKGDQLADWLHRPLTASQLTYAAGDVAHLLEIRRVITERLDQLGRTEWAAEECAVVLEKDRAPNVPEQAWWKLPHSRQLRGVSRGIAQEVAAWRERRAQRLDLPVRFVLSDLAIVGLAQRPPRNREELKRIRGVDARHVNGEVPDELMRAVAAGKALEASAVASPPAQALERLNRPMVVLASAYVSQRAGELEIDPATLATRADLLGFFQDKPVGRLASGWRHELIGAPLLALAKGRVSLAFDGRGDLVLEERSGKRIEA